MSNSNQEIIKFIESAKKNKKKLTHITDKKSLSTEDKIKINLCRQFVKYLNEHHLKLKDMARLMNNIPIPRLSEITNYKINKFTVDQLIKNLTLLSKHDPLIQEYLVFLEEASNLITLSVKETRKLTRTVRQASA